MAEKAGRLDVNELIDAHNSALLRVIIPWTRDRSQAEDVLQEVWIKVYQNLHRFRGDSGVFTWLYRIAVNTAINQGRKRRFENADTAGVADPKSTFQPEKEFEKSVIRERLARAVEELSGRHREIFLMRAYNDMPYEEIGRQLKISALNARVVYHHAVDKLRKKLDNLKGE